MTPPLEKQITVPSVSDKLNCPHKAITHYGVRKHANTNNKFDLVLNNDADLKVAEFEISEDGIIELDIDSKTVSKILSRVKKESGLDILSSATDFNSPEYRQHYACKQIQAMHVNRNGVRDKMDEICQVFKQMRDEVSKGERRSLLASFVEKEPKAAVAQEILLNNMARLQNKQIYYDSVAKWLCRFVESIELAA